ncbi:MAG TPA: MerR family transcriptional regulator [Vicinamibacterales bacterium]|nr:MerR family transcriptional regulator [Vicinamibacterales bacterium]
MTRSRTYQVKDVARLARVSVRTLHHYDAIGLLVPTARTAAGYRLYTDSDLLRLQQILIGRELGLPLEEIRRSLEDPRFDRKTALLEQRERLNQHARQAEAIIRAIDLALAELDGRRRKGELKMEELFQGFNPSEYEEEARRRWGASDAFAEAQQRTGRYTPDDWKTVAIEQAAVYDAAYAALKAGKSPSDSTVMDIAERHRMSIDRWFYPCSHGMHRGLASMYESDERFRKSIDKHGEGLTPFLADAIRANAARHQA